MTRASGQGRRVKGVGYGALGMAYVNIVTSDRGWILEKLASEITNRLPYVRLGCGVDPKAALQYYVTYSTWRRKMSPIEVCYFAHLEQDPETRAQFFNAARNSDHCVCHSKLYEQVIRDSGVDRVTTISPGVDLESFNPVVKIGVVGRTYHTGRKGEALVRAVMDVPGIEWHFTGEGWPGTALHVPGDKLTEFYNAMDYILVPALYEGGPMCVVEALACGVPVIASDVGWVPEFPHIPFKNADVADLRRVLEGIVAERQKLRDSVVGRTWDRWAEGHDQLFRRLFAERDLSLDTAVTPAIASAGIGKAVLLTHGSERSSLGGPTIRVPMTATYLRQLGTNAHARHFPDPAIADATLVHGFNVWSPDTASLMARRVKSLGKPFVFSPIFLDHAEQDLWARRLPAVFSSQTPLAELGPEIEQCRAEFEHERALGWISEEGAPGHHALAREAIGLADHVIYLSDRERDVLGRIGITAKASTIVRNPVDPVRFGSADGDAFAQAFGFKDYILCVARVEPRKNQLMLLQALHGLDMPIVLIGAISNKAYGEALLKHAGANVHLLGRIEPDGPLIPSAVAGARVVVLPSWIEGAPLAGLEAGAAGASMVLSDRASESEYFGSHARYCDPANPGSIREQVLAAYDSPVDRTRREALKAHVADRYSWTRYAEETRAVYYQALMARSGETADTGVRRQLGSARANGIAQPTSEDLREASASALVMEPVRGHIVMDMTTSANHKGRWTGIARFEMALARALIARDRDAVSFVAWHDPSRSFVPIMPSAIEANALDSVMAAAAKRRWRLNMPARGLPFLVGGSAWMQNTVYAEAVGDFAASQGLYLTPVFHDIIPVKFPHWFDEGYAPRFVGNLRSLLLASRDIISVSQHTRRDLISFAEESGLFLPEIKVVREGDDFEGASASTHTPPNGELVQTLGDRPFALAVGAVHVRKNYGLLYNLWTRLAEQLDGKCPILVIVGGVAWNGKDTARALTLDPRLAGKVRILTDVDDASLAWLYGQCLFTLYPSLYEGWGLPVAESLAHGKICLASNTSSVPEIAAEMTDLLDPLDFSAWYTRAFHYIGSRSSRDAREAQIRNRYQPHSWHQTAAELTGVIAGVTPQPVEFRGYALGTLVTVATPPAEGLELSGFFSRERWGTWTCREKATLDLDVRNSLEGSCRLVIKARALAKADDQTSCRVSIDGHPIGTLLFTDAEVRLFSLDIPEKLLSGLGKRLRVELATSRLVRVPKADPKSDRLVGIGVTEIGIIGPHGGFVPQRYASKPVEIAGSVRIGERIDLLDEAVAKGFLSGAIATTAAWGCYTRDGILGLKLFIHEACQGDLELKLHYRAVATADKPIAIAIVGGGEHDLGTLIATDDSIGCHTIRIPRRVYANVQPLVIEFGVPADRSPEKLGLGHNPAAFGLGLFDFTLLERVSVGRLAPKLVTHYRLGDEIYLGASDTGGFPRSAEKYLVPGGWHRSEAGGRWTLGRKGRLAFQLDATAQQISIRADVFIAEELLASRPAGVAISMTANGSEIARLAAVAPGPMTLTGALPAEIVGGRMIELELAADCDFVPFRSTRAEDDRLLGLFVRRIVIDDAARTWLVATAPKPVKLGDTLTFGIGDEGGMTVEIEPCLDLGSWHNVEADGRWSNGPTGRLVLDVEDLPRDQIEIQLVATAGAGASETLGPRMLTLRANGVEIARSLSTDGGDVVLIGNLGADRFDNTGKLELEISVDQCFQPSQVFNSDDRRVLGVFAKSVSLRPPTGTSRTFASRWSQFVRT